MSYRHLRLGSSLSSITVSSNGDTLAVSSPLDHRTNLWNLRDWSRKPEQMNVSEIVWSPDGRYYATSNSDQTLVIRDSDTQALIQTLDMEQGRNIVWSHDSQLIAAVTSFTSISIWRIGVEHPIATFHDSQNSLVYALAWSNDDSILVSGGQGGRIEIWEVKPHLNEPINWLDSEPLVNEIGVRHDARVLISKISCASTRPLCAASMSNGVVIFDPRTAQVKGYLIGYDIAFSTDGSTLAVAVENANIVLWDARNIDTEPGS